MSFSFAKKLFYNNHSLKNHWNLRPKTPRTQLTAYLHVLVLGALSILSTCNDK